jgi:hypothetical protein
VRVRSGETPGSPVARLPASVERPPSKRSDKVPERGRATGQSATSSEVCGVVRCTPSRDGSKREPSRQLHGEGHGRHSWSWSGCRGTLRRKGRGTARRLTTELERSSSAPGTSPGSSAAYNRRNGKWQLAERKSEGVVVVTMGRTTQPARSEGPLLHRCVTLIGGAPGECFG